MNGAFIIGNTERSIVCNEGSADAHALLADLYGRKIGYSGMLTGMRYGPKAEAETRRALQLDANNPRIYVVLGRRQLYSPKIFGGDVDKAIESFRKSTTLDPYYDEGFVWLAIALGRKAIQALPERRLMRHCVSTPKMSLQKKFDPP